MNRNPVVTAIVDMKMTFTLSIDGCNVEKSVLLPMRYGINAGGISKDDMTDDNTFNRERR